MKKKIILHGYLKDLYDAPIEVEADTIAEAVRSLQLIPELQPVDGKPHPVRIKEAPHKIALYSKHQGEEINIYPRIGGAGGKNGGLVQVLLGVAMISLAIFAPAAIVPLSHLGITSSMVKLAGLSMAVGGLIQMLMPMPETTNDQGSKYLGSSVNSVSIGTPIPIVYGTRKISGHYLSFDVDAKDIAVQASGTETFTGAYVEYDKTPLLDGIAPVNPIYSSAIPSATNIPTSSWNGV